MMPRVVFSSLAICLLSASGLLAENEAGEPMEAKDLPDYNQVRDPFWPIGHVRKVKPKVDPAKPVAPVQEEVFEPTWPKLKLKAVTTTPRGHIAIIDKIGLVEEGQIIKRKVKDAVYTWRIDKISSKGFTYTQLEAKPAN